MSFQIVTVVGARPQFVKAAPVSRALRAVGLAETLVHTGQHYDPGLSDVLFAELGLAAPDHHLGVGSGAHGEMTARILERFERLLLAGRPDCVLVFGDTNSTLAGALAAAKQNIPVAHVEAGMRSFDPRMPEEINRRLTGHLATWHYCATRAAVDNLAREGVTRGVVCAGDVMADAVAAFAPCAVFPPPPLAGWGLRRRGYAVLTCHRAGNTDDAARLGAILEGAARVGRALPVVFPVHPRTRARLGPTDPPAPGVRACGPLSYLEMLGLTRAAALVLTDSGGLQKEAYLLGTPCLTLREETEWTETVATGWNRLVGANAEAIAEGARLALAERPNARPELFGDGRAAERIAAHLARALAGGADRAKEPAEPGPSPR